MSDPNHDCVPVRYFCTAGNGMESFLVEEVKSKVAAQDVIHLQGKVIFSSSANINNIVKLKSAERLFLLLNHEAPLKLPAHINQAKASSLLQSKLMGDKNEVARAALLWLSLQGALKDRSTNHKVQPTATVGGKRRDNDEQSLVTGDRHHGDSSQYKRKRLEHGNPDDALVDQQAKLLPSVDSITFRICCKCSGSLSRYFSTQDISKVLGASLTTLLGWRVDLKNPHLEVNVNLTDDYCLQGIPLTKFPLANRNYVQTTGLRSPVAWAMGSMAQIEPGSFVVDPMCGVGTILIEAAKEHNVQYMHPCFIVEVLAAMYNAFNFKQGAFFLGIDIDDEQLVKASGNIVYAHLEDRMQVLKASSLGLPLHSTSVDAVVCDLPFGRKFGTKMDAAKNLPLIVSEMTRVLRVGGILVLLLSPQLSCLIKRLITQEDVKSNSEIDSQTEKQDCLSDGATCTKQLFSEGPNNEPPSAQETECLYGQKWTNPFSALRHEKTVRVSLGAIDGLMHKYVKLGPCFK